MGLAPQIQGNGDCISTSDIRRPQEYRCPIYQPENPPWINGSKSWLTPRGKQQTEIMGDFSQQGRMKWLEEYDDSNLEPEEYDEYALH